MVMGGNDYCSTVYRNPRRKEVRNPRRGWKDSDAERHRVAKCGLDLTEGGTGEGGNEAARFIKCEECLEC